MTKWKVDQNPELILQKKQINETREEYKLWTNVPLLVKPKQRQTLLLEGSNQESQSMRVLRPA